jgi:hypothetical protein
LISVVAASARSEKDIGGNRNPKCMVANKGNLDEHPYNCETYKNERESKTELHYATPLRLNMNSNIGAATSASGHRALWGRALPARFGSYHTQATRDSCLKKVI